MNIAANLELLKANKDAIRNAITRKGILTGGNDELSSYPDKIMRIGRGVVPDIPDLSVLENHEDIIYFSVRPKTYWGMTITLDTGTYTVESGTIVNGSFVSSDISAACASNTNYFCINDTDSYAIYQLTCTSHITAFVPKVDATKGTIGIAEVYGAVTPSFRNLNFTGITSLRTCTIKGTLELVTNMTNCFSGCSSLTTLDTSSWVLSAVTNMSSCFYNCSSLTTLDTSSWVLNAVTSMSQCFNGCSSLTSLRALNMTNCSNYDNVTLLKLVNFRYIGYGTLGVNKSTILFASQVAKADIIQFFSDLYNRASAGYSVIAIIITQKAANYTSAEIAVATNKGYTVSFNG